MIEQCKTCRAHFQTKKGENRCSEYEMHLRATIGHGKCLLYVKKLHLKKKQSEELDHHSPDYVGTEGVYRGIDANDVAIEKAIDNLNEK